MFGTDAGDVLTLLNSEYEQYKVPSNWCWANIGSITNIYRGVSYKKNDEHREKKINDCLVMRGGNVEEGRINLENDNVYVDRTLVTDKQLVRENDIIIVSSTGSTRVIGRAGISFSDYSDVTFGAFLTLVRPSEYVNKRYVAYYFQSDVYRNRIRQLACGVNINNIRNEYITETPIPLPPLSEQNRIVKKIELLFTKLDKAKEKAQEILDSFNMRKASILNNAFSGMLTEKWRKEHKIELESWKIKSINDLCHSLKYGTSKKSKPDGSVVVIRMGNLQQGEIDWSDLAYSDDIEDIEKYKLYPGDVLFNRTNSAALVGKTSIYRGEYPAIYAGYLIKLDYDHELIVGDYLNYALNTTRAKEYCNTVKTDGVNQSNINAKKIGSFEIPVATIKEQREIVKILRSLLEKEKEVKQTAESLIEQIDLMKKSVLSKAFRGELGTNNPNDENADRLLIEILSEKTTKKEKQQKIKQERIILPKEIEAQINTGLEKKIIKLLFKSNTKEASVNEIMSISSKTFDILDAIRTLENKQLIKELKNKQYKLLRQITCK